VDYGRIYGKERMWMSPEPCFRWDRMALIISEREGGEGGRGEGVA